MTSNPTTTPTRSAPGPLTADTPARAGLYDVRYGEVLLVRAVEDRFQAEVWNTLGMNDCPQAEWDALDAAAIATEHGALLAILNGPRHWVLDSIRSNIRAGAPETTFGGLGMFQAAVIDFGTEPPVPGPYIERSIVRDTVFGFNRGREVHELVAPDGTTYVMQAYCQAEDPSLTTEGLAGLADRLQPPEGWSFASRTLVQPLNLLSIDGVATVLQDELQNTYQRNDHLAG